MTMDTVITFLVGGIISSLITSFIHTLTSRNNIKKVVMEVLETHEKIRHQVDLQQCVKEHTLNCKANAKVDKIERAVLFLVMQVGGSLKDLGLGDL